LIEIDLVTGLTVQAGIFFHVDGMLEIYIRSGRGITALEFPGIQVFV
jgi:hypothetical protein